jgi:hypothetical protein
VQTTPARSGRPMGSILLIPSCVSVLFVTPCFNSFRRITAPLAAAPGVLFPQAMTRPPAVAPQKYTDRQKLSERPAAS